MELNLKDEHIKDYDDFCRLAGYIEFTSILSSLPKTKEYPNRALRRHIEGLWHTRNQDDFHFTKFSEILSKVNAEKFFKSKKENEVVSFINHLFKEKYFPEKNEIKSLNELTQHEAADVIKKIWFSSRIAERFVEYENKITGKMELKTEIYIDPIYIDFEKMEFKEIT